MIDDELWEKMRPALDPTRRRLAPRSFVAYCEREPGRLQLRLVLARDEHIDDIVVDEEEDCVIAFASVCGPTTGAHPEQMECPFHVYLERPLGDRKVVDSLSGRKLPYPRSFDRPLVAQCLTEGMPIVSGDAHFAAYGVETRW
jgi:hypothetical protein